MKRICTAVVLSIAVGGCGEARTGNPETTPASAATPAPVAASNATGDPCALISDTTAVFGRTVTASREPMPNMCRWQTDDAAMTASLIVHGSGWSAMGDPQTAYDQMAGTLAEFGATEPVAGLGDQAIATQPGSQVQIVFRKGAVAANVGASSSDTSMSSEELAKRIARAVAERL